METLEFTEFKGKGAVYSNRPPTAGASGGAQEVIAASKPTWWVGPETISTKIWNVLTPEERGARKLHGDPDAAEKPDYDVQTFFVPEVYADEQYKTISNEVLWPIAHSMLPNTDKTLEEIEEAYWGGYTRHNEIANNALRGMVEEYDLVNTDRIWVHDYQCENVPGTLYTRHIPFPTVDFLEKEALLTTESGDKVSILDTEFFRDIMELSSTRILSTFQRPVDQVNFIMTAAVVSANSEKFPDQFHYDSNNPILANMSEDIYNPDRREKIRAALLEEITLGSSSTLTMFGSKTTLMNIPVGQVTENTYAKAVAGEHDLTGTSFKFDKNNHHFSVFHADIGDGQTVNLTSCDEAQFNEHNPPHLSDFIEEVRGRKIILSAHRNDYTKGTLTKLEAAEKVLESGSADDATFFFMLQPTREDVAGYKEYAQKVFKKAAHIREKFGPKSVVILPEGIKHDDVVGLMRQPEIHGFMALGLKDGHDLTAREILDANDNDRIIGNITSSGIGAADVLGEGNKGSFIIKNPTDANEVAAALTRILDDANTEELRERFNWMKSRSKQYDAANFSAQVNKVYMQALRYHFDAPGMRERFMGALGDQYIDRRGDRRGAEDDVEAAEKWRERVLGRVSLN